MDFAISTHWNARKHSSGEAMLTEIIDAGFKHVELGYDLTLDLVPGVQNFVENGDIIVNSLHNFCPVPIGAPMGHPELFHLADTDIRGRLSAVRNTINTISFAAQVHAKYVVVHTGNVDMPFMTRKLLDLIKAGRQYDEKYEKIKLKLLTRREDKVQNHLDALNESLAELMPELEKHNICLAMENLPSWESIPTESEIETICKKFDSPHIRYWHDLGHGQTRQNLGFIAHLRWIEKLSPFLVGMHVHDIKHPASDHLMPPNGELDFSNFKKIANSGIVLVLEPASGTPVEEIVKGHQLLKEMWDTK